MWVEHLRGQAPSKEEEGDELLAEEYKLHVKPACDYQQGEKVVFTYYGLFGPKVIHPGTEAEVAEVEPAYSGKGTLALSLPNLGVRYISAERVDSVERGDGNLFRSLGQWIPCRKEREDGGWVVDRDYVKARLDDGSVLEGRCGTTIGVTPYITIGETTVEQKRIANMIVRRR